MRDGSVTQGPCGATRLRAVPDEGGSSCSITAPAVPSMGDETAAQARQFPGTSDLPYVCELDMLFHRQRKLQAGPREL